MRNKLVAIILLTLLFIGITGAGLNISRVIAANPTLYIDPSSVTKTPADVGSNFTVSVKIQDVTDLFGFRINITWDNTLITFASLDNTSLNTIWPQGLFEPLPGYRTGVSFVRYDAVATGQPGFNGSGTLFTLTFNIASGTPGQTSIHFDTITVLSDSQANPIPAILTDGHYQMLPTQWTLTVSSAHDSPSPGVGTHVYSDGSSVTCNVASPVTEDTTVWTCVGWTGTGSVPLSSNGTSVTFIISQNSTITWNWNVTPVHDVATTNVTTSKTGCVPFPTVDQNFTVTVNVTVKDTGDYNESTVNVMVYVTQTSYYNTTTNSWTLISPILQTPISIGSATVGLNVGQNRTITFTWDTTGFAYGNYTISATVGPVLGETNIADHTLIGGTILVTIQGDINGDFNASLSDLVLLAHAYHSEPGDANWNPNADMDGNGIVSLSDLVILGQHYHQHYP